MTLVLIVEDNPINRDVLGRRLERRGFSIRFAEDGPGGIAAAKALIPDVILMDIGLGEMDGCEATRRIRADSETAAIPIIALTASAFESDRAKALAAAASTSIPSRWTCRGCWARWRPCSDPRRQRPHSPTVHRPSRPNRKPPARRRGFLQLLWMRGPRDRFSEAATRRSVVAVRTEMWWPRFLNNPSGREAGPSGWRAAARNRAASGARRDDAAPSVRRTAAPCPGSAHPGR